MSKLRPDLPPLPARMQRLAIDSRGYPVPYFVKWIDGKPEFRVADNEKWVRCVQQARCWVCGDVVGKYKTFVIGPMCAVNRTTSEPPCHLDCAVFSAIACPFLTLPKAKRNMANLPEIAPATGIALERNPGVSCLWTTLSYRVINAGNGPLLRLGDPTSVSWYCEKRAATRQEILASVDSGMPFLRRVAQLDEDQGRHGSLKLLDQFYARMLTLLPSETTA
jgi:hypothetical protein